MLLHVLLLLVYRPLHPHVLHDLASHELVALRDPLVRSLAILLLDHGLHFVLNRQRLVVHRHLVDAHLVTITHYLVLLLAVLTHHVDRLLLLRRYHLVLPLQVLS